MFLKAFKHPDAVRSFLLLQLSLSFLHSKLRCWLVYTLQEVLCMSSSTLLLWYSSIRLLIAIIKMVWYIVLNCTFKFFSILLIFPYFLVLGQNYYHNKLFINKVVKNCLFTIYVVWGFLQPMPQRPENPCTSPEPAAQAIGCQAVAAWQSLCLKTDPLLQPGLGSGQHPGDAQNKTFFF